MASSSSPELPHIVSLVLQSKKALQQGEALCSRAHTVSNASAQTAFDLLAVESKVKWMTDAVLEQLKLAADVAKSLQQKRAILAAQAQEWDTLRKQRTDALDAILDALGGQVVPPDFHQSSAASDVFGPQFPEDDELDAPPLDAEPDPLHSPATIRGELPSMSGPSRLEWQQHQDRQDRGRWKTLRDFVDERGIEDALERMEAERSALDDLLFSTADFSDVIHEHAMAIRLSLPAQLQSSLQRISDILNSEEATSTTLAQHLESLAVHYDKISEALKDSEAGEPFEEEDLKEMISDVDHLPSIISELEQGVSRIQNEHERLINTEAETTKLLDTHKHSLVNMDNLGELMSEMIEQQHRVETESESQLLSLHDYLESFDNLQTRYSAYQFAYNRLLLEMGRRKQYQEAAQKVVHNMITQLKDMTEEERRMREVFKAEHGDHLPDDLCLSIENLPTKWAVAPVPWTIDGGTWTDTLRGEIEVVPEVEQDLLSEARDRIANNDGALLAAGSLASI